MGRKPAQTTLLSSGQTLEEAADILFVGVRPVHGMRAAARRALSAAAHIRAQSNSQSVAKTMPNAAENRYAGSRADGSLLDATLAELSPHDTPIAPLHKVAASKKRQARQLSVMIHLAEVLSTDGPLDTRLLGLAMRNQVAILRVGGPGARSAVEVARKYARSWREAFSIGLRLEVVSPTTAELEQLASVPLEPTASAVLAIQRALAKVVFDWERTLSRVANGQEPLRAAILETERLRQLLAGLRPALKRRSTKQLRLKLSRLRKLLQAADAANETLTDIVNYQGDLLPDEASRLAGFVESASAAAVANGAILRAQFAEPAMQALSGDVRSFVGELPLHRSAEATLSAIRPRLLENAVDHVIRRQRSGKADGRSDLRRSDHAILRLTVVLEGLGAKEQYGERAQSLLTDLQRTSARLQALIQLEFTESMIATHLDQWAEQQARRKAPQLHGAEGVLTFRQGRRAVRAQHLRTLTQEWKPIWGRTLRRRVAELASIDASSPQH